MKPIFSTFFLILFCFCACKPLDVEPQFEIPSEQAFNNVNDLEVMVNGAYQALQSANCYGAAYKMIPDIFADYVTVNPAALRLGRTGSLSLFNIYQRQTFGSADNVWRDSYTVINRCNLVVVAVLNNLIKDRTGEYQNNADRILGEAYCLRALMYFELLRLYAHQYGINENVPNSGIILLLKPTTGRTSQARATTKEVYDQIEIDLKEAARLLPTDKRATDIFTYGGRAGGRATKYAAMALLARVYFQKATDADDVQALFYANAVINNTETPFPLNADTGGVAYLVTSNFRASPSVIFQVSNLINPLTNEANSTSKTLLDSYFFQTDETDFPTIYLLNGRFTSALGFKSGDQRITIGTTIAGSLRYTKKYQGDNLRPAINVPVIRVAELLLIRAEISYVSNRQQTIDDIFQIRDNAYFANGRRGNVPPELNVATLSALSADDLLKEIIKERTIELNLEGDRLHHFKRVAKRYGNVDFKLLRSYDSRQRNISKDLPWDSDAILFQIPDAEISTNPLAVRNP